MSSYTHPTSDTGCETIKLIVEKETNFDVNIITKQKAGLTGALTPFESFGEMMLKFNCKEILSEDVQRTETSNNSDNGNEDYKSATEDNEKNAQLKFECDEIGVEILELDGASIPHDKVDEFLETLCDDGQVYCEANTPPDDVDQEINGKQSSSGGYTVCGGYALDDIANMYPCMLCSKRFLTNAKLQRHVLVHVREKQFQCKQCHKLFSHECYRNSHKCDAITAENDGHGVQEQSGRRYNCRVCAQSFESNYFLKKHVQAKGHESNVVVKKPYSCAHCLRSYTQQSYLRAHKCRLHTCEKCGMCFSDLVRLERHAVLHGVERSYSCGKCGKLYHSLPGLRYHEMNHTGERPHVCSTCGKSFSLSGTLKVHETCHSEQRPFPCTHLHCGKSFSILGHLRKHELRHTGERPHSCPQCSKHFADIANLNKHLKVHVEVRPYYLCSCCDKQYVSVRGLRDHQAQHAKESIMQFSVD